jgi:hypothetical protein
MRYDSDDVVRGGRWDGVPRQALIEAKETVSEITKAFLAPRRPRIPDPPTMERIEANRRNAQLSTGPKTEAGKKASSRNAIKLGIYSSVLLLPEENREQYNALCDYYVSGLRPEGLEELNLVEEMIVARWKMFRLSGIEQGVYHRARDWATVPLEKGKPETLTPSAEVIMIGVGHEPEILKAVACVNQLERGLKRDYHRASARLKALQDERKNAEPDEPVPPPQPESEATAGDPDPAATGNPEPANPAATPQNFKNEPTATPIGAHSIPPNEGSKPGNPRPNPGPEVRP